MPAYQFFCDECRHEFEHSQRMSDDSTPACAECKNTTSTRKLPSFAGLVGSVKPSARSLPRPMPITGIPPEPVSMRISNSRHIRIVGCKMDGAIVVEDSAPVEIAYTEFTGPKAIDIRDAHSQVRSMENTHDPQ